MDRLRRIGLTALEWAFTALILLAGFGITVLALLFGRAGRQALGDWLEPPHQRDRLP